MRHLIAAVVCAVISSPVWAQTVVPHTFTPGTPAKASQVNENFSTLGQAIDSLRGRVTALERQAAVSACFSLSIVGTYHFVGLVPSLNAQAGRNATISHGSVTDGLLDLRDNNTYSSTFTLTETTVTFGGPVSPIFSTVSSRRTDSGTWSLERLTTLTLSSTQGLGTVRFMRGGERLFFHVVEDPHSSTDRSQRLLFMIPAPSTIERCPIS